LNYEIFNNITLFASGICVVVFEDYKDHI